LAPQKPEHSILCSLAKAHGTDKYPWYTPFYSALFADKHVKRVLEIGVLNGASLAMWRDYWPQAEVWGFDKERRDTDIQVMYGDQSKPEDLAFATRLGPFDIVIDDGSHQPADQILGALTLVPHLASGGLYIIEDVNSPFILDGIPWPNQLVFCHVPGSDKTGRCVVIPCPS
jgi:demethylmacrocin O-methyltransferase